MRLLSNTGTPNYAQPEPGTAGDAFTLVPGGFTGFGSSPFGVIKNEVILTLTGFTGLTSTSQLSNVGFAVGSTSQSVGGVPTNIIVLGHVTPEPGSLGLLMGLVSSGALYARRRRNRR